MDDLLEKVLRLAEEFPADRRAAIGRSAESLATFLRLLLAENLRINLISAASARSEVLVGRHLRDSLLGLPLLPEPGERPIRLLDIGSGGGFPAVPILILRPDLLATLVESAGKKCRFLRSVCSHLSLTVRVVNARFPDAFPMNGAARFDVLTTRAVAEAGRLVRGVRRRRLLTPGARALLWTTEALFVRATRQAGCRVATFHPAPGAERRGIALLQECST